MDDTSREDTLRRLRKVGLGALVGLGGTILAVALWLTGALELFELKTWDVRVRLLARPGPATGEASGRLARSPAAARRDRILQSG